MGFTQLRAAGLRLNESSFDRTLSCAMDLHYSNASIHYFHYSVFLECEKALAVLKNLKCLTLSPLYHYKYVFSMT